MFTLIQLPYADNALEPVISARTISFHHGKHLQAYVDNLNKLLPGTPWDGLPLEEIVAATAPSASPAPAAAAAAPVSVTSAAAAALPAAAVFNNAGQVLNHNMYFTQFAPSPASPDQAGKLVKQILKQWGTLDAFKDDFVAKGVGLFGSGWVWLAAAPDGALAITQEPGAGNPVTKGLKPILTFDVWEHAYYLDYQNRRAAQLQALWQFVDWAVLEERYCG